MHQPTCLYRHLSYLLQGRSSRLGVSGEASRHMQELPARRYWSEQSTKPASKQVLIFLLGHKATECKANRVLDLSKIATKHPEEAWEMVKRADAEGDLDDFREVRFPVADLGENSGTY